MQNRALIGILLATSVPSAWAAHLDTSGLSAEPLGKAAPSPTAPSLPKREKIEANKLSDDEEATLRSALESFNFLIPHSRAGADRNKLVLNRARASLAIAQRRLMSGPKLDLDEAGRKLLQSSTADATWVYNQSASDASSRSDANFLIGLSSMYLNNYQAATVRFEKALSENPKSPDASWMAFFVAEEYFEERKFADASKTYRDFFSRFDNHGKRLALYKIAWCYLNLNQVDLSEKTFLQVIRTTPKDDITRDSIRDLAHLLANMYKDESEVLSLADQFLGKSPEIKFELLRTISLILEARGLVTPDSKLLAVLVKLEKDPVKAFELQLGAFSSIRREYASRPHYRAWMKIRDVLDHDHWDTRLDELAPISATLDNETKAVLRSYVDTFSGKVKTPEQIPRKELGQSLLQLFDFYIRYLPQSKLRQTVYSFWFDVCDDLKDSHCTLEVSGKVLEAKDTAALQSRAELELISALEDLTKADPKQYHDTLSRVMSDFVAQRSTSEKWLVVAKRWADLQMEGKEYEKTIPLRQKILEKEATYENFYALQWARFQAGHADEVLKDRDHPGLHGPKEPRLVDVVREAALKEAVQARKTDDAKEYVARVRVFLDAHPDAKKASIAKHDLVEFLLDHKDYDAAEEEYFRLSPADRKNGDFSDSERHLIRVRMKNGEFARAGKLIESNGTAKLSEDLKLLRVLAILGNGHTPDAAQFAVLSTDSKDYVTGLLALFKPGVLIEQFDSKPPRTAGDRAIALLALRMRKGEWEFPLAQKYAEWLGKEAPEEMREFPKVPFERKIEAVRPPSSKLSAKKISKAIEKMVGDVRTLNGDLAKVLAGLPAAVQLRVLVSMHGLQDAMVEAIDGSPAPDGLNPDQIKQYKDGLHQISQEFKDQAQEIEKLRASVEAARSADSAKRAEQEIRRPSMNSWGWPDQKGLRDLVDKHNGLGALIVADLMKGDELKNDDDYFAARAGIILSSLDSKAGRIEVFHELEQAKQSALILKWRELAK